MAFPAESPAPPAPVRPVQVTAAVWCLYALAVTQILSVIVAITSMGPTLDATRGYVEGTRDGDAIIASVQIGSYFTLAFGLAFAVGLAVLAVFVNRGNQPARIISWVVLGLLLCCNGFGVLCAAAGGMLGGAGTGEIDQKELARRIEDAVPGWVTPVNYLLLTIGIVASAAGIILLALPLANEFFRRPQQVWEPPLPGATYPIPGTPVEGTSVEGTVEGPPAEASPVVAPVDTTKPSVDTAEPPVESTPFTDEAATDEPAQPGQTGTGNPPPAL
jgi:hypothetical protein